LKYCSNPIEINIEVARAVIKTIGMRSASAPFNLPSHRKMCGPKQNAEVGRYPNKLV
jgi:hypothetical protein